MKRLLIGLVAVILGLAITCGISACGNHHSSDTDKKGNEEINSVKNAYLEEYSTDITIGEAINNFLDDPRWRYFVIDNDIGIVECSGGCKYDGDTVGARIQFKILDEESFEVYRLLIKDKSQNDEMINFFFEAAYGIDDSQNDTVYNYNDEYLSDEEEEIANDKSQVEMGQYMDQCIPCTYEELARDPEMYIGKKVSITGKVYLIWNEEGNTMTFNMHTKKVGSGDYQYYLGGGVCIQYTRTKNENRVLEDDEVVVYGEYKGLHKNYNSPFIIAKYVIVY